MNLVEKRDGFAVSEVVMARGASDEEAGQGVGHAAETVRLKALGQDRPVIVNNGEHQSCQNPFQRKSTSPFRV